MGKEKVGRKQFDGQDVNLVVKKLEEAFAIGCTDEEACLYAGISRTSLYRFEKKNPEFRNRKQLLKHWPILKARQELIKGLEGNPELALKYLERKKKDEFSPRSEHAVSTRLTIGQILDEIEQESVKQGKPAQSSINSHQNQVIKPPITKDKAKINALPRKND